MLYEPQTKSKRPEKIKKKKKEPLVCCHCSLFSQTGVEQQLLELLTETWWSSCLIVTDIQERTMHYQRFGLFQYQTMLFSVQCQIVFLHSIAVDFMSVHVFTTLLTFKPHSLRHAGPIVLNVINQTSLFQSNFHIQTQNLSFIFLTVILSLEIAGYPNIQIVAILKYFALFDVKIFHLVHLYLCLF